MSESAFLIVCFIAYGLACGFLSMSLAMHKGQSAPSWFFAGLFFGILGLIAAAGLPTDRPAESEKRNNLLRHVGEGSRPAQSPSQIGPIFKDNN